MRVLASAIMFVVMAVGISGQSAQKPKKFLTAPLTIEDQGSFFIGGVQKVTYQAAPTPPNQPLAPHQITIGQMYVQFQIPAKKYGGWPVIMVHGSSHTAACLESTPDGREGWYPYFVRKGVPSYVVDQAGRGRSGFDESVIHEGEAKLVAGDPKGADMIPAFGRITDDGAWTNWFGHLVPANSTILTGKLIPHGDPADPNPHPDAYAHVAPLFPIDSAGLVDRLARRRYRARAGRSAGHLRARVLQAAGAERRGDAAGIDLQHLRPERDRARQHLDAAEPGVAGRAPRRRDRRHALAVGDHGTPHGPHPQGARPSRSPEGPRDARGLLLAAEQRTPGRRLRQHSVPRGERATTPRPAWCVRTP